MKVDDAFRQSLVESLGTLAGAIPDIDVLAESMARRFPSAVRCRRAAKPGLSTAKPGRFEFPVRPIDWYTLGFECQDPLFRPSKTLDYAAGDFYLQDAGSMLALAACDADRPDLAGRLVCDLCAAPGGKASALLESIGDGFLLANEPVRSRVAPLAFNLARTGCDRYAISTLDPDDLAARLPGRFDLVLVDAPCSGQALLGRGKQSLSAVSMTQVEHSAQRARRILAAAFRLVRPGGQLVLSTCTFAEAENEDQVRWAISQDGVAPFPVDRLDAYDSGESGCCYRLWPDRHGCAGSFAASLVVDRETLPPERDARRRGKHPRSPVELSDWYRDASERVRVSDAVIWGWPDDAPPWVESIASRGPELAYRTGRTWKPSHEAAVRREPHAIGKQVFEVDDQVAAEFLSGHPIGCDSQGWCVVQNRGRPLGWIKASRGTGKNQLPTAARFELPTRRT